MFHLSEGQKRDAVAFFKKRENGKFKPHQAAASLDVTQLPLGGGAGEFIIWNVHPSAGFEERKALGLLALAWVEVSLQWDGGSLPL